jgi:hypothetical protein
MEAIVPRCSGGGPVDVHTTHEVWSAVVLTSWKSIPALSCKSCGVKRQIGALAFSGFLGWWGFPFGLILTPIQVVRNLVGMLGGPRRDQPSQLLVDTVTRYLAAEFAAQQRATTVNAGAQQYVPPPLPKQRRLTDAKGRIRKRLVARAAATIRLRVWLPGNAVDDRSGELLPNFAP